VAKPKARSASAAALPALTSEGLRRLVTQLGLDRQAVLDSSATASLKRRIKDRIDALQPIILTVASLGDAAAPLWAPMIAPEFVRQTADLKIALGLSDAEVGACRYRTGCIQCTAAQCQTIGGVFQAGGSCP
jgi:hypothetical protein